MLLCSGCVVKVTKKTDLSDFYFNLGKNVAFGAKDVEPKKPVEPETTPGLVREESAETSDKKRPQKDLDSDSNPPRDSEPLPSREELRNETSPRKRISAEPSPTVPENLPAEQPKPPINHHKRSEDAVAAAKERFLARKRAKEQ